MADFAESPAEEELVMGRGARNRQSNYGASSASNGNSCYKSCLLLRCSVQDYLYSFHYHIYLVFVKLLCVYACVSGELMSNDHQLISDANGYV